MRKLPRYTEVEVEEVVWSDYPDFSDAYLYQAWDNEKNRWCTTEELVELQEDGFVNEYILDNLSDFTPYD